MEAMQNLTTLIAANGVYALSVIFIFYLQRRSYQNLREASAGHDRGYFRRVHVSVIATTYVLVFVSCAVWFYATYMYQPVRLIKGEVIGLLTPFASSDADPVTRQQLAPERAGDLDFYHIDEIRPGTGEYSFRWVLVAKENLRQIAFRFVQESATAADIQSLSRSLPEGTTLAASNRPQKRSSVEKRFVLDLAALNYAPTHAISLSYKPDHDNPARVGTLWLSNQDGSIAEIKWMDPMPPRESKSVVIRLLDAFMPTAFAMGSPAIFNKDGSYNPEAGRALQLQLGSEELRTRLSARQILVQSGSSSFRFIMDVLNRKVSSQSGDIARLLDNLSKAIDEIELRGERFPPDGHLKLAVVSYNVSDYQSAALHFDKAGDTLASRQPVNLSMRAHSYVETERLAEAVGVLNRYLAADISQQDRAWGRHVLGFVYGRTGRWTDAVSEEREAVRLAPGSASFLNGLAYTYAKQGVNLSDALTLIDRALFLEPDEPTYVETRGYVLFRLGRVHEALDLIRKASVKIPDDVDTQRDLKEVEAAARGVRPGTQAGR